MMAPLKHAPFVTHGTARLLLLQSRLRTAAILGLGGRPIAVTAACVSAVKNRSL
jgi:hypothetical protein